MKTKYYKHPKFGQVYGEPIATPIGRLAWPYLVEKKEPMDPLPGQAPQEPRYEVTIVFAQSDPKVQAFLKDLKEMVDGMVATFNQGRPTKIAIGDSILKDGNNSDLEKYPFYKDSFYMVARTPKEVICLSSDGVSNTPKESFVGGVQIRAQVCPLCTSHGISFRLEMVQFVKDDQVRFGGGTRSPIRLLEAIEGVEAAPQPEHIAGAVQQMVSDPVVVQPVSVQPLAPQAAAKAEPVQQPMPFKPSDLRSQAAAKVKGKTAAINLL